MEKELEIQFTLWKIIREQILNIVQNKSIEQFFKIPEPFSNNIIWIFGHIVRTRNFLILKLAGNPSLFPKELDTLFAKGSCPKEWKYQEDKIVIENQLFSKQELVDKIFMFEKTNFEDLIRYINDNYDKSYLEPYKTSTGYVIQNSLNALQYNIIHESIHLGQLQLYNKLV